MVQPAHALLAVLFLAAVGVILFWPGWGYVSRRRRHRERAERILVEDALKRVFEGEYRQRPATLETLSGTLAISRNRAARLLMGLEARGLAVSERGDYRLTREGRQKALRIIRAHRLWERYLAEETGLKEADWHREAERREHLTSPEEADALEDRLHHPRYDPHGDPIPTADGDLPPERGHSLSDLPVGQVGSVVHIEDEPDEVFAELVAAGVLPGMEIQITDCGTGLLHCIADGRELVLPRVVASNVSVVPLPEAATTGKPNERLSALKPGESATVTALSPACRGMQRRRVMDLGITPGTVIAAEMQSPMGDPTAYRVRGALIALRRQTADLVYISTGSEGKEGP